MRSCSNSKTNIVKDTHCYDKAAHDQIQTSSEIFANVFWPCRLQQLRVVHRKTSNLQSRVQLQEDSHTHIGELVRTTSMQSIGRLPPRHAMPSKRGAGAVSGRWWRLSEARLGIGDEACEALLLVATEVHTSVDKVKVVRDIAAILAKADQRS